MSVDDPRVVDLHALAEAVHDEKSFVGFLDAFGKDFALERDLEAKEASGPYWTGILGWENGTVDAVFDAAVACWRDHRGDFPPPDMTNIWRRCATILLMGKHYE